MQHNLQRPRLIVEVVVFASSPDGYLLTIRIAAFRHFVSAKCPRTIEIRTPVQAFHSRPCRTGVLSSAHRWPQRFSRSGDRDEVAAISDPCILLQSELQINAYDRYRGAKDIAEASAHPEPSAHTIK